jgi:hypothetical protein
MAQVTEIRLIDDLDKGPADETVSFGLDGKQYIIDLSGHNATVLRENLADFIAVARRDSSGAALPVRQQGRKRGSGQEREQSAAVRAWARQNGHTVRFGGGVSTAVGGACAAAH